MSSFNSSVAIGYLSAVGFGPELVIGLVFTALIFAIMFSLQAFFKLLATYSTAKVTLVENTVTSDNAIVLTQDPSDAKSKLIIPSDNQLTGVEFTYAFYLLVNPSTFNSDNSDETLRQVFYKGYSKPFPLMGPGVFIFDKTNTMRVFMNSYQTWYSFVDIPNIPTGKWFHTALVFRANNLEVYINGNLTARVPMDKTYPYQNSQNLIIFGNTTRSSTTDYTKLDGTTEKHKIGKSINGQISRFYYYGYALSFSEIQALTTVGASSTIDTVSQVMNSISLTDTWYTSGQ
jgi:hypothetical protein